MSGSGGGSGGGGGGGFSEGTVNCELLVIRTFLNSPKPSVISKLKIDDLLDVEFIPPKGPIVVKNSKGQEAGSITAAQMQLLIKCIVDGYIYQARVISINGGQCEVEIRVRKT